MTDESGGDEPSGTRSEGSPWAELLADADAIATEYREDGWTVDVVEPQDVAPWAEPADEETGARGGFVALVDDADLRELEPIVDERTFGAAEVYQRTIEDATLVLLVELDAPTERAIVLPLYYRAGEADGALASADEAGELQVRVRADGDDWLTFVHDDPSLFDDGGRE